MIRKTVKKLALLLILIWFVGYGIFVINVKNKTPDDNNESHAIIILTGGNNRIDKGLELFNQKKAGKLFITGVNASVPDNDINALWKGNEPLPCCVELGRKAKTTRENAIETKEWIHKNNVKSILLVTSDYHIDRALQEFKAVLPKLEIKTYPVKEIKYSMKHLQFWKITLSEYNKLIFRKIILTLAKKG